MTERSDVFISYSRRDTDFVRRLFDALQGRNLEVWVDWEDIEPTSTWWQEICRGIEATNNFVFVISPDAIASSFYNLELEHARQHRKRIIPLYRRDTDEAMAFGRLAAHKLNDFTLSLLNGREILVIARDNWNELSGYQRLDFRDEDAFDGRFAELLDSTQKDLDHVRGHTRWGLRARDWADGGQPDHALLRGGDLLAAEAWLMASETKLPAPTELHRRYISASKQYELRAAKKDRRRQRLLLSSVFVVIAVIILSLVAVLVILSRDNEGLQNEVTAFELRRERVSTLAAGGLDFVPFGESLSDQEVFAAATQIAELNNRDSQEPVVDEAYLSTIR
jgi:hypothetical protein